MINWPAKAPSEVLDYTFDLTGVLQTGETITAHTLTPVGVTINSSSVAGGVVSLVLSGGTQGTIGRVTLSVTTTAARTYSEVAVLEIGGGPISLADAKEYLREDDPAKDDEIAAFLQAAVDHVETTTDRFLTPKVHTDTFRMLHHIRLTREPVREIVRFEYDPVETTTPVVITDYRLVGSAIWSPFGVTFPSSVAARVTYVAGYDPGECPASLLLAVKVLLSYYNENREGGAEPASVASLLRPFRAMRV